MSALVQAKRIICGNEVLADQETVVGRVFERAINRFRTELPITVTGKPQKFPMLQAMLEEETA